MMLFDMQEQPDATGGVIVFPDWFYANRPEPPDEMKDQEYVTGQGGGVTTYSIGGSIE